MSVEERNKTTMRRYVDEIWSKGNLAAAEEYVSPELVWGDTRGLEGHRTLVAGWRVGLPDLEIAVDDAVAEGNTVAIRYTVRGTHRGEIPPITGKGPIAPSGKRVEAPGTGHFRFDADGRIVEAWANTDFILLLRQIGELPAPAQ